MKTHEWARFGHSDNILLIKSMTWCFNIMYGKQHRGIERSTFVIDKNGVLRNEWRGLRVDGHASEVLKFVWELSQKNA